jgi:hypothetical protein
MATDTTSGSLADAIAAPGGDSKNEVIPWGGAFLIDGHPDAPIELDQHTSRDFVFVGPSVSSATWASTRRTTRTSPQR